MFLARNPGPPLYERVAQGSVVTIGAYDGLHIGHEQLLAEVTAAARERNVPSVVMSFEPTPREYFATDSPPVRLMRFRDKFEALANRGVDILYCPRFDDAMRWISADTFIRRLLVHELNVHHLVIGDDFRFGARREGNVDMLRRAGAALEFSVARVPSVVVHGRRVSSTAVRIALRQGDMALARNLLGRYYSMSGKVIRGESAGRAPAYRTADVHVKRRLSAVTGTFAVRVSGLSGEPLAGVASIGMRPTLRAPMPRLEVHILDFDNDIYGERIRVEFVARLRDEQAFDNTRESVAQLHRDSVAAREILAA